MNTEVSLLGQKTSTILAITSMEKEALDVDESLLLFSLIDFKLKFRFMQFIECMVKD